MRSVNRLSAYWTGTSCRPVNHVRYACSARGRPGTNARNRPRGRSVHGRGTRRAPRGALSKCGWHGRGCSVGVGAPGLEPGTSALSGPRSNHLSYAPQHRHRLPVRGDATSHRARWSAPCQRRSARPSFEAACRISNRCKNSGCGACALPIITGAPASPSDPSRGTNSGLGAQCWWIIARMLDKVGSTATRISPRGCPSGATLSLERR